MSYLSISLLGSFQVRLDDAIINANFRTRKERALLAYLAVEVERHHRREALSELFWPDRPEGYARTNLRQALFGVRRALEEHEPAFLTISDELIQVDKGSFYQLDVEIFNRHIQATRSHAHKSLESCPTCAQHLQAAVDLYRGDFLEDVYLPETQNFQEWVVFQREQYFRALLQALYQLGEYYQRQGDFDRAYKYAWRYVNLAPLEEAAHRQLMNILALSGQRSAALEQYQTCRRILLDELGVEPSAETVALNERIKTGIVLDLSAQIMDLQLTNLPALLTSFFGREAEVSQLDPCLSDASSRLITIVGMAGAGKTRLAHYLALNHLDHFTDGVWFVPLEHVRDGNGMAAAIAQAIGLPYDEGRPDRGQFFRLLRPLQALLLLDGYEHLAADTDFLAEILEGAPEVKILATSRQRLNYRSACLFELAGLPGPEPGQALEEAIETPALQLFLGRAQHSRAGFTVTAKNLPDLVRICCLVGGLPLALELAAAQLRDYTTAQIAAELERGLEILQSAAEDVPARHRSMRAALQASWERLAPTEKALFRRLSALPNEFTQGQALAEADATPSGLANLVSKYLLRSEQPGVYRFDPLLRHFAIEKQTEETGPLPEPPATPAESAAHAGAIYDWLTNLPTRAVFWDRLEHMVARCERQQQQAVVGMLLIENLDRIESESPAYGEKVLRTVAERLTRGLRRSDTVARFSRRRFALILEGIRSPRDTVKVAAKLRRQLEVPVDVGGRAMQLGIHMGFCVFPWDGKDAEQLLERAELALDIARHQEEPYLVYTAGLERA